MHSIRYWITAIFLVMCQFGVIRASGQASVNENESSYLYVDANQGADSNPGTAASPFKTITAAVNQANALNRSSVGVKVVVNPGIYRESVTVAGYSQTSAPLTIEAASAGTAVIAGSDVLVGWTDESAASTPPPGPRTWDRVRLRRVGQPTTHPSLRVQRWSS